MYLGILFAAQHSELNKRVSGKLRTVAGLIFAAINVAIMVGCAGDKESTLPVAGETQSSALVTTETQTPSPVVRETQSPAPVAIKTQTPSPVAIKTQTPSPVTSETQSPAPVATKTQKPSPVNTKKTFYIYQDANSLDNHYKPTGYMGDIGDIQINEAFEGNPHSGKTSIQVVYKAKGNGPNKCEYSTPSCKWAGVYWQEPPNNWGTNKALQGKGFDLSDYSRLVFWARADKKSQIEFKVGGINNSYGDSLTSARSKTANLTQAWQKFEIDLEGDNLKRIIGGFAWAANQDNNPNGVTFYLDDIRFERK